MMMLMIHVLLMMLVLLLGIGVLAAVGMCMIRLWSRMTQNKTDQASPMQTPPQI